MQVLNTWRSEYAIFPDLLEVVQSEKMKQSCFVYCVMYLAL